MNSRTKALLKQIERGAYSPRVDTKKQALLYYKAKRDKKKIPVFKHKEYPKNSEYAKMSIEEWEKKYLNQ